METPQPQPTQEELLKAYEKLQRDKQRRAAWYKTEKGREHARRGARRHYEKYKMEVREKRKAYYEENAALVREKTLSYYYKNREKILEQNRQRRAARKAEAEAAKIGQPVSLEVI